MATTARSRPCVDLDIHMDSHTQQHHHLHQHHQHPRYQQPHALAHGAAATTTEAALGELSLNSIHNIKRRSSIESLARQLDDFHICSIDKENKSRAAADIKAPAAVPDTKDVVCGGSTSSASGGRRFAEINLGGEGELT